MRPTVIILLAALAWASSTQGDEYAVNEDAPRGEEPVVFARDVQPIFQRRCIACHGPDKMKGGLRLDGREFAVAGGQSGVSLLTGDVEDSELLRRVTSDELGHRMPLEGPPLADNEIAALRSWVAQGTPWPEEEILREKADKSQAIDEAWWLSYTLAGEAFMARLGYAPYAMIVVLLLGLVVRRLRRRAAADSTASRRWVAFTGPAMQLFVVFAIVSWAYVEYAGSLRRELAEAQQRLVDARRHGAAGGGDGHSASALEPYIPPRPEKSISATYYRGNDERNPKLFNGGFYRTATFRINFCDAQRQPLEIGSPVGEGPLFVRLEIERAPQATPALFTPAIMKKALLSPIPPGRKSPGLADDVVALEQFPDAESWVGYWPIRLPDDTSKTTISGMFYVCQASVDEDAVVGTAHYNVMYDLVIADGKLQAGSDLQMGSLYRVGNLQVAVPGMIQNNEWFDSRPIPVIAGENSDDPKLLGVEQHLGE